MIKLKKKITMSIISFIAIFPLIFTPSITGAMQENSNKQISDGVIYKDIRQKLEKEHQAIRVLEMDMKDTYTSIELGLPTALNRLATTTSIANKYSFDEHQVVGAINGSFFHAGVPMNLLAENNKLIHAGEIFSGKDKYVNEPIAFGTDQNGKGIIDHYKLDMHFKHKGNNYEVTSTNKVRSPHETILYTSSFPSKTTNTNEWGSEIVVTLPTKPTLEFGSTVTGTVSSVKRYPEKGNSIIPENGFVLSSNGEHADDLGNIEIGDSISLSIDIDNKWKDSSFMLASGPLLVKDGIPSLTMDPASPNARAKAPRSAVAIDETGDKVFFVTVDGRQKGYSNGMSLSEFATYLTKLGADRALNLDGGGSTTMAVRYPGNDSVQLANKPSDSFERSVSAILMAVSTAPDPLFPDVPHQHWAYESIEELYERGTITGYPDGTFKPDEPISRQLIALMLAREYDLDTENIALPNFKDVTTKDKYYREIATVAAAGLLIGKEDGLFGKDDYLTRGELAVILQRVYKFEQDETPTFPDVHNPDFYAYDAIHTLGNKGVIDGYPDGTFKPHENVSRAMFSQLLAKAENAH